MKIENLAELYEMHYPENSKCTLRTYQRGWDTFKSFMKENFQLEQEQDIIENTNWSSAQLFKNSLVKKGLNPKTVNNTLSGLRSYFDLLFYIQAINENPFKRVKPESTKSVTYERPFLEGEEFDILLETIATKEKGKKQDGFELTSARDQLAVGILLSCGLRIHELLNIKVGDIQPNGELIVLGKGNKLRLVKIGDSNMARLQNYLEVREWYAQDECEDLFISRYGKGMSPQSFNKNLKKYLERAGLDTNISAHGLRKSSATNYLREGVDIARISKMLGHANISTTQIYAKASEELDFIR